eukprot:Rhum_TRINITY_DN24850_c0_g1::Rhum_TRINITY_DN24850_c0_g1_i1::g.180248::m.180248
MHYIVSLPKASPWTSHTDPATGDLFCYNADTSTSVWGDRDAAWSATPGGGFRNALTGESAGGDGAEAQWGEGWYACSVTAQHEHPAKPGHVCTVDVLWDDGTCTMGLDARRVRNRRRLAERAKGALWDVHVCWDRARQFYTNRITGDATWTRPPVYEVFLNSQLAWSPYKAPGDDGEEGYVNSVTGEYHADTTPPPGYYALTEEPAEALWCGAWYPCVVWRRTRNGNADVRWEDGTGTKGIASQDLRMRRPAGLEPFAAAADAALAPSPLPRKRRPNRPGARTPPPLVLDAAGGDDAASAASKPSSPTSPSGLGVKRSFVLTQVRAVERGKLKQQASASISSSSGQTPKSAGCLDDS